MQLHRIYAIVLRHLRPSFRDPMRYLDTLYWPLLDLFLFGFMGLGLLKKTDSAHTVALPLVGLVFWQIVFRSNLEVARNLLEEIWHNNLVNLFASPLRLPEWMAAVLFLGLLYGSWSILFGFSILWLLFGISASALGLWIVPFAISMLCMGWSIGLFSASWIIFIGRRAEMMAWSIGWLFAPFGCVFYAVDVLPAWAQPIAWCLPITYMFESMRTHLLGQPISTTLVAQGFALNALYLALASWFFIWMFAKSKNKGLGRLE